MKKFSPFLFAADRFFHLISPVLRTAEEKVIRKYGTNPPVKPLFFIAGAPRSGSTLLYQILTNQFDLLYIDNLIDFFHRNLLSGFSVSNLLYRNSCHNYFLSEHGDTRNGGFHAPSECAEFWYLWLDRENHFADENSISEKNKKQIRSILSAIINRYKKPLIFKNLNSGQRIRLLNSVFPESGFIFIRRNQEDICLSILNARKKLNIPENDWWSVKPANWKDLNLLPLHKKIVLQVFYLEKEIYDSSFFISPDRFYTVYYEMLLSQQEKKLSELHQFLGFPAERSNFLSPEIVFSEKKKDSDDLMILKEEISTHDWENFSH